ncbi:MAG TPA: class I adenylate-forming enzyme family protein [Gaiellaceae bacterium]
MSRPPTESELALYPSFGERPHTLPGLLERQERLAGDRPAFLGPDGSLTFAEWAERARAAAAHLREQGVREGDRVGLWAGNDRARAWAIAFLGIQWAGATPVPMSPRLPRARVEAALDRIDARLLEGIDELAGAPPVEPFAPQCREEHAAGIFHTSGTTGAPKAAILSHACTVYIAAMQEEHLIGLPAGVERLGPDDVLQTSVPLHTTSGLMHLIVVSLFSGCRLVCEERFDAAATAATMAREGSTIWFCVPSMMVLLGDRYPEAIPGARLRIVWHAGSVATPEAIAASRTATGGAAHINLYSLTETGAGMIGCTAGDAIEAPGTVGRPPPSTRIWIADGELRFESPYMFDGYFGDPEATEAVLPADGWFRSGDGGRVDGDGRYWVTGRLGDVIIRGGNNINPSLVEDALMSYPGLLDAAVVPVPHRVLGQDLAAFVVSDGAVDAASLHEHCLARLAPYEVPPTIVQVDSLPRNEFGKLDRRSIREAAAR